MTASVTTEEQESRALPKDLLSLGELEPDDLKSLIDLAEIFRSERKSGKMIRQVPGSSLALIFEKPSTRTRVSFEVGMFELGGHAVVLNSRDMQSSRGESLEDTAKALSQFCHAISARVVSHETLETLSRCASIPVINALSDLYHPCQTLADLETIKQFKGKLEGLKLAWVGDGNNVCNSLIVGAALSGINMWVACPEKYSPLRGALEIAESKKAVGGGEITVTRSAREAVYDADVVVTDTFVSMGQEEEKKERLASFLPEFQINEELMTRAKGDAIFMHCLPAHRGEEVTPSVIDGPHSVVWQEAQNRLHAQKALIYTLIRNNSKRSPYKLYR